MSRNTRTSKVLNTVLAPVGKGRKDPVGTWRETVEAVEREAGLADGPLAESFEHVLTSLADEPQLTPLGWTFVLDDAKGRYTNRLRIKKLLAERPEIAEESIEDPVFVLGMPRTATTLTHRLLAASSAHRGPLLWEMMHTGVEELTDPQFAARQLKKFERSTQLFWKIFSPDVHHMHPTAGDQPEESLLLMPHGYFWSMMYGELAAYNAWYDRRDHAALVQDYQCLKEGLQVLQHGRARKRWVMKYVGHLNDMETIKEVFPGATFVWTHRDPVTVAGSTCSMFEGLWAVAQKNPDREVLGRYVLNMMKTGVDNGLAARLNLPPSSIVDVSYQRLCTDPQAEVPRLYGALGATWTTSDAERLDGVLAKPAGTRAHRYDLADYGLDRDQVTEVFTPYQRLLERLDAQETEATTEL